MTIIAFGLTSITNSITSEMAGMGANNIMVGIQQRESEDESDETGMRYEGYAFTKSPSDEDLITRDMIESLVEAFPDEIKAVSVESNLGQTKVENGRNYANINLRGVNPGYFIASNIKMAAGNEISKRAYESGKSVCVVSDRFVNNMFGGDTDKAIGHDVEIEMSGSSHKYYVFTIVGVYEYEAQQFEFSSAKDSVQIM